MSDQYYSPSDKKARCVNTVKNYYGVILALSIGLIIIVSWVLWISPTLKNSLLESYTDAYLGKMAVVDKIGDNITSYIPIYVTYRQTVEPYNSTANKVVSKFVTYDVFMDKKLWSSNKTNFVDSSGKYIGYHDAYFRFPANTQKQNYTAYLYASGDPQPFIFNGESSIDGIKVYKFSCKLTGDLSDSYPQFQPRKILSDYTCNTLIEPTTGDQLYYDEHWTDYAIVNDTKVPVSIGNSHTTALVKDLLIVDMENDISSIHFYDYVIPSIFILGLAISSIVIFAYHKQIQKIAEMKLEKEKDTKLATIGLLASRLAHDIRNPLSVIKNAISIMEYEAEDNKSKERFSIVDRAISRITHQIDDVMDFVRIHPLEIEQVDISTVIEKSIKLLKIPESITLNVESHNVQVHCDRKQLEIVFNNLITNAIESLQEKGTITIRVKETGNMVNVSVEDSGPGVPPELMKKIFEPLFTTKQTGTGLGLISCKNILEQHGGKIIVSNNPSTFTVILPKKPSKI